MKILLTGSGGFTGTFFRNFLTKKKVDFFTLGIKDSRMRVILKFLQILDLRK